MISNQFSPHFDLKDSLHMLMSLFLPNLGPPSAAELLPHIKEAKDYEIVYGNSARVLMREWAKAMNLPKGAKIALPAYFCAVGALPFLDLGLKVVWVDVKEDGTMNPEDLAQKIAKETIKVVVVAHNFGRLADVEAISNICKPKGIKILTDCAHGWSPQLNFANAAVISFGREKVLSTVSGGAIIWETSHDDNSVLQDIKLPKPSKIWTIRHALQPIVLNLALKTWPAGKVLTHAAKKLQLLPRAVSQQEKQGKWGFEKASLPKSFYRVLKRQLTMWEKRYHHAEKVSGWWIQGLETLKMYGFEKKESPINKMRVITSHPRAIMIKQYLRKHSIDLQDWEGDPIAPSGVDYKALQYQKGSCPNAEKLAKNVITFPTHQRITQNDVEKTIQLIRLYLEEKNET